MKNTLLISFLMAILVFTGLVGAALYKGVDSEGKVVYSDTPFDDAEKYTPAPISVVDTLKSQTETKAVVKKEPAEFKYREFDIVSPANKATIRNVSDVAVSLNLKPGLNVAEEHNIWVLVNGKPVIKNVQSLSFKVEGLERGANELQAQIRDKNGKVVVRTRTTVIFVHQASAL